MQRLFLLRKEVKELITAKLINARSEEAKKARKIFVEINKPTFWLHVGYISDLYTMLNTFCRQMQGPNVNVFTVRIFRFLLAIHLFIDSCNIFV